jgi:Leucine-rich repeat (LRR) protein
MLRKLRLATNKIQVFNYIPDLPNLEKIDVKENQVAEITEFGKLRFPKISKINVSNNPAADEVGGGIKTEILILLEDFELKAINKDEVLKEDIEEAQRTKEERIQKDIEVLIFHNFRTKLKQRD